MPRIFYALGAGIIGAVLLHVIIILAVPSFTGLDAFSRVLDLGETNQFHTLEVKKPEGGLAVSTPFMYEAVCAFSVSNGPVLLTAEGTPRFWSAAIYDTASNEVFSMNDRTSIGGVMSVIAGTPAQIAHLRNSGAGGLDRSILIETPDTESYAVVRAFYPTKSLADTASAFVRSATCRAMGP